MNQKPEKDSLSPAGLAVPPPIHIEAPPGFQGSLVTLFHLAREGRVDLTGIPLTPVCKEFLEYLQSVELEDVDSAGAALLALAYLVERKAWALLPIADPPPPQELPELPEPTAHEYATAVDELDRRKQERDHLFFRAGAGEETYDLPFDLGTASAKQLARAFERLMERAKPVEVEPLGKPRPSVADVMKSVLKRIQTMNGTARFEDLMDEPFTRLDVVFVFLSVLELARIGQIRVDVVEDDVCLKLASSP